MQRHIQAVILVCHLLDQVMVFCNTTGKMTLLQVYLAVRHQAEACSAAHPSQEEAENEKGEQAVHLGCFLPHCYRITMGLMK